MKKVLVIDDDPVITLLYQKRLMAEGFNVEIAADGLEGLVALKKFQPNVVLLDLQMPTLDGIEWLREIRCYPKLRKLPVVVFTAGAVDWQVEAAQTSDAMYELSKAFTEPAMVVEAVARAAAAGRWPL
jgi:CheY-like chemotaxis protein